MNISKVIGTTLALALVSVTLTGCLPKKVPVQKTKTVSTISMELNKEESSKATQDGITIKVNAIHPDNIKQYAALMSKINYWYYRTNRSGQRLVNSKGQYLTRTASMAFNLVAYPAFEVKITNSTDHVLRLSKAVIVVEDDKGNSYDALSKSDMNDYLTQNIRAHFNYKEKYHLVDGETQKLQSQMRNLRILDNNLKVLPGKTVKAYVALNYGKYTTKEAREFIMNNEKLSLGLYELPSEVNQAGDATKTTNFNFVYDIHVKDHNETYTVYEYR